jgi:hypothetical protein
VKALPPARLVVAGLLTRRRARPGKLGPAKGRAAELPSRTGAALVRWLVVARAAPSLGPCSFFGRWYTVGVGVA